jgi:hypothetical protein
MAGINITKEIQPDPSAGEAAGRAGEEISKVFPFSESEVLEGEL